MYGRNLGVLVLLYTHQGYHVRETNAELLRVLMILDTPSSSNAYTLCERRL